MNRFPILDHLPSLSTLSYQVFLGFSFLTGNFSVLQRIYKRKCQTEEIQQDSHYPSSSSAPFDHSPPSSSSSSSPSLAIFLTVSGDFPQALVLWDNLINENPMEFSYYYNRSLCWISIGEYSKALEDINYSLDLSSSSFSSSSSSSFSPPAFHSSPRPHLHRGRIFLHQQQYEMALREFRLAKMICIGNYYYYSDLLEFSEESMKITKLMIAEERKGKKRENPGEIIRNNQQDEQQDEEDGEEEMDSNRFHSLSPASRLKMHPFGGISSSSSSSRGFSTLLNPANSLFSVEDMKGLLNDHWNITGKEQEIIDEGEKNRLVNSSLSVSSLGEVTLAIVPTVNNQGSPDSSSSSSSSSNSPSLSDSLNGEFSLSSLSSSSNQKNSSPSEENSQEFVKIPKPATNQ